MRKVLRDTIIELTANKKQKESFYKQESFPSLFWRNTSAGS